MQNVEEKLNENLNLLAEIISALEKKTFMIKRSNIEGIRPKKELNVPTTCKASSGLQFKI